MALGFRVLVAFARVETSLRRDALPRTCQRLRVELEARGSAPQSPFPALDQTNARRIRRTVRAVELLAPRWPWGDTCLRKCLVLGCLLRDLRPTLALGVRRADQQIAAHSWLLIAGQSLDPTSTDYERLAV